MATPTPFAALGNSAWQVPNPLAQRQSTGIPGTLTPFWGQQSQPTQSATAAAAQNLRTQLAATPPSPFVLAGLRTTTDVAAQFCLGLALLLVILTHH